MAIPHSIQKEHILKAIAHIRESGAIPAHRESQKFDLLYNSRRFPPKYVLYIVNTFVLPKSKESRGTGRGGRQTNNFLISRGFKIVTKDGSRITAQTNRQQASSKATNGSDGNVIKGANPRRRFWVVSPNVKYQEKTVPEWRQASIDFSAAFMGWGPDDPKHKIGPKFAHAISEGDVILIARSFQRRPNVVGFGVVTGAYQTRLRGFTAPGNDKWQGSIRTLSPFIPRTAIPPRLSIMKVLNQTAALHELHPATDHQHRLICGWMATELSIGMIGKDGSGANSKSRNGRVSLKKLFDPGQLDFEVRTPETVRMARKLEAELVNDYRQWLKEKVPELKVANYQGLRCDAYEEERNNLIEAKSSGRREYIRMAVGQLLDYAYLGRKKFGSPNMAILLPRKPEAKLLEWLAEAKISVIWKQRHAFVDNANGQFI